MANEDLKKIYDQVFKEVKIHPQIKGLERGLLYKSVQIILGEEESQTQEKTQKICNSLNIKPSANRDDDYKIIADLIEAVFIDRQALAKYIPGKDWVSNFSIKVNQSFIADEEEKMKWIVVAACTLVGVYFCIQYLKDVQQQKAIRKRESETTKPLPPPSPPIPAALCLIVSAKIASSLQVDSSLSASDVEHLMNSTSYFLCTTLKAANLNEQNIGLTDDYISPDSQREVYLRIDISDGRDLIDKKILYILKTKLPTNAQFIVKQLACLRNLSGLEVFNRV